MKKKILEQLRDARFSITYDKHPSQYKIIEDILSSDFNVKFVHESQLTGRIYYIIDYLPKKSISSCNEEIEVEDVEEDDI